jgi:hypothetical protein
VSWRGRRRQRRYTNRPRSFVLYAHATIYYRLGEFTYPDHRRQRHSPFCVIVPIQSRPCKVAVGQSTRVLVQSVLFDTERKMGTSISTLFGTSRSRISFDDKDFRFGRTTRRAIGQFSRQHGRRQERFASDQIASGTSRGCCRQGFTRLNKDSVQQFRTKFKQLDEFFGNNSIDGGSLSPST